MLTEIYVPVYTVSDDFDQFLFIQVVISRGQQEYKLFTHIINTQGASSIEPFFNGTTLLSKKALPEQQSRLVISLECATSKSKYLYLGGNDIVFPTVYRRTVSNI